MKIRALFIINCIYLLAVSAPAQVSPKEALAGMETADGLEVTVFAAEPDLRNPTSMDIDAGGRVWVCEAVNYRLFNQPITDTAGDRIRVLEDTDGDGRCDKAWTYYQDPSLQSPMGIAVLGDRVYVCQSPDLFYLRDTDGDGRADEKTVVLSGFKGVDHDHAIHGVTFGPDGLLYFSVGDRGLDVTDKSGHRIHAGPDAPYQAATVLRTDLEGRHLELLASNMRNPYEPTVDSYGNVYISDNDDDGNEQTRINYVMEGGNYGYWPRRKGDRRLDAVHWNMDRPGTVPPMHKTGFGSPTGITMYEGDLLPERYHNTILHADAGPGEIRSYRPIPNGAGFNAEAEVILSCPDDSWFRPSDVCVAPDGSVFVADWYDPGVGGHRMGDTAQGRVYRIAPKGAAYSMPPMDMGADEGIAGAFASPNQARRYVGYRTLEERFAQGETELLNTLIEDDTLTTVVRTAWIGGNDYTLAKRGLGAALQEGNPLQLQVMGVRMAAANDASLLHDFDFVLSNAHSQVRRQTLVELARAKEWQPWMDNMLLDLALRCKDDRFYVEAVGIAARGRERELFDAVLEKHGPEWDETLGWLAWRLHPTDSPAFELAREAAKNAELSLRLRKLALDTFDALGTDESGREIVAAIGDSYSVELRRHALHLLSRDEGDAWRGVTNSDEMDEHLRAALVTAGLDEAAWHFVRETRRVQYTPQLVELATDADTPEAQRRNALQTIRAMASRVAPDDRPAHIATLATLLEDESLRGDAMRAIAAFRHDDAMQVLRGLVIDTDRPRALRQETVRLLARDRSGSVMLVTIAENSELPADLTLDVTELLHGSRWDDIRLMAEQTLPRDITREGAALPPLEDLLKRDGDPQKGRAVFFSEDRSQCYTCHRINGEGREVGPDLSKIGEKLGKQGVLESILNPSAAIAHEYVVWMVRAKTLGYVSGYIRSESDTHLEIMEATGNPLRIRKDDIVERWESELSLMPTGLSAGMTADELVDLTEYLTTLK